MRTLVLLLACGLVACSDPAPVVPPVGVDAEDPSGTKIDAGVAVVHPDAAAHPDAERVDVGGEADAGSAAPDADAPDAIVVPDTGSPDAGSPDSGAADAGRADAAMGSPDAMPRPDSGAPETLSPGWIGGPCMGDGDCNFTGGRCLREANGWPRGTCTQDCTRTCPDRTMPLDAVTFCVDDGNGDANGICLSRCDDTLSPTGCRAGYVCLPEKRMSQASVVRNVCVPEAGVPGRPVPAFDIGAPCASASDCNRATCLSLPGGYCSQERCDVVGCPTGSVCFGLGDDYYACLDSCTAAAQCRTGENYSCDSDNTCWPLPPPPAACDLVGAANDCAPFAAMTTRDFVVITKNKRRMTLCNGAAQVRSDCVALGLAPVGDKEREGDRKTPEGVFYIPRLIPNSMYYKAFLISYPDNADAARGLMAGLITQAEHDAIVRAQASRTEPPQSTGLGGLIEIHGAGAGPDWTFGCIATENTVIDALWPVLGVGDNVVILP